MIRLWLLLRGGGGGDPTPAPYVPLWPVFVMPALAAVWAVLRWLDDRRNR